MLNKIVLLRAGLFIAAFALVYTLFFRDGPAKPTMFQGYMEGQLILMGPEAGGRIAKVFVAEGDDILKGGPLFQLDTTYELQQVKQAEAVLAQAKAELENLRSAQMRSQEIGVLEAKKKSALAAKKLSQEELERKLMLYERRVVPKAQLDAAKAAFNRDKAALDGITKEIDVAHLAARKPLIEAAAARLRAARAELQQAKIRLDKRSVASPMSGHIEELNFSAGEVVAAGQPVVALLPPANIKARFFVTEKKLSQLKRGGLVKISCDGCADDLRARIDFIAREAEYTPPVIYGPKERARLVFRVEARAIGKSKELSPGQPVTVIAFPQTASQ